MTVVHTYFYIVVDTQRGCHTQKTFYVLVHNAGSCEQGTVPLNCIKREEFLDWVRDC